MITENNSIFKIFIFLISFTIFITNVFAAYTITDINISENYIGGLAYEWDSAFEITGTLSETTSDDVVLNISSNADSIGLDFSTIVNGTSFNGTFYTTTSSTTTNEGWPKIQVTDTDVITVSGQTESDTCIFDIEKPSTGTIESINSISGGNFNNFYSKDLEVNFTSGNDDYTYIDKYLIWIVEEEYLEDYYSYAGPFFIDNNSTFTKTIDSVSLEIPDGNYYFLLDLFDIAGNRAETQEVIDTNINVYIDNSPPTYEDPNVGPIGSNDIIYIGDNTLDFNIEVSDISGINSSASQLSIINPSGVQVNPGEISFLDNIYSYSSASTYNNSDVFQINLEVYDNVDNFLDYDFNIVFDLAPPTRPDKGSPFLDIDEDKNITIKWTASIDLLSGVKNYSIYRSTSSFTDISQATKIYTTPNSSVLTYEDISEKDEGRRYYYAVVANDYANNVSEPVIDNIHSGPEVSLEIEDDSDYTNKTTPKLYVEFSSDVNEMRFSCNESTWTSWIEVDGDDETYSSFNITSGNGCNSDEDEKTIYVQVRSEDDYPNRTSKASNTIYYDKTAPEIPLNVVIVENNNGSLSLSWDESEDNNSNSVEYKIYYSFESEVSSEDSYFITNYEEYTSNFNDDVTVYFRVSAIDEAENESELSTQVSGESKRVGPSFSLEGSFYNIIDDVIYVGKGLKTISVKSDEELNSNPTMRLKVNNGSSENLPVSYSNLIASSDFNFSENGSAILTIRGTNKSLQNASDEFEFIIDANSPVFDFNYSSPLLEEDTNFNFYITNFSSDIFRVQYLLDNKDEICLKQFDYNSLVEDRDFNCVFNSEDFSDGNYKLYVLTYDKVLNVTIKIVDLEISNVNELKDESKDLKESVSNLIKEIENKFEKFELLLISFDELDKEKLIFAKEKFTEGNTKFDSKDYFSSKENYTQANNLLNEILEKLPVESEVKSLNFSKNYDSNIVNIVGNFTLDVNVSQDTIALYESNAISLDRNFSIQEIDSKKYFSVSLEFKNNSSSPRTITVVETIPKAFEKNVKNITFNKQIEVLVADPVIKFTLTIPANSSEIIRYNKVTPITEVDAITKFTTISFVDPIVLAGEVTVDKIIFDKPVNYELLTYIVLGMVVLIIFLIVLSLVAKKNKMTEEQLSKPTTKDVMNSYFGKNKSSESESQNTSTTQNNNSNTNNNDKTINDNTKNNKEETSVKKDDGKKFKDDYDFIMNAIKKR